MRPMRTQTIAANTCTARPPCCRRWSRLLAVGAETGRVSTDKTCLGFPFSILRDTAYGGSSGFELRFGVESSSEERAARGRLVGVGPRLRCLSVIAEPRQGRGIQRHWMLRCGAPRNGTDVAGGDLTQASWPDLIAAIYVAVSTDHERECPQHMPGMAAPS